ncbi:unnamed protein product [Rotaria magnacalcarata]|uniref:Enoyl reductase (ER) domain-containing protein n=5 Tax=Rotaria magnacalcarata TaxID=392030 RepID=A0A814VQ88_9BILA|nr:unnamed protein product [Rotaria magnacalcarata]CAF1484763.1 unnamed protein product [Rotaria magnacalcarata]CAF2050577.1 unnamed protein product [Rotaria magnacalcarata]CAF2053312.1 unnamed protein product [Rotaria magnacalcarata]CAF2107291.1 unnamed protein product [Rotaria magnacalcarata]
MISPGKNISTIPAKGWAVYDPVGSFSLFEFERRSLKDNDVLIRIYFCGICHTDIHEAQNDWNVAKYPMVPGHEITGIVEQVGSDVKRFQIGDPVGVGCLVDSCRTCLPCQKNLEQHCTAGATYAYNGIEMDQKTPTYGGYSNLIVVTEHFVCLIPKNLPLDGAAPLLCAGTTTYSALRRYNVIKDTQIGIIGLGGLGHIALKLAVAMGAHVTVIALSESQRNDAIRLGAKGFIVSNDQETLNKAEGTLNFIIDTVPVSHNVSALLQLLAFEGVFCMIGLSSKPIEIAPIDFVMKRLKIWGSLISGMREMQEMLNFCSQHEITCDIELIEATPIMIKTAFERILKGDVKYRFVLDMKNAFK